MVNNSPFAGASGAFQKLSTHRIERVQTEAAVWHFYGMVTEGDGQKERKERGKQGE
jgi:hypothetical protein